MHKVKTNIYYRDLKGDLRSLTYGDVSYDINSVKDQGKLVADIIEMGLTTPASMVLCAIETIKYKV